MRPRRPCDAAIVAGHSIAHLASGTKIESCTLSFTGRSIVAVAGIEADRLDLRLHLPQDRGVLPRVEARRLEVGRQGDLQHVDLLVRRADRLRVGAAQRQPAGLEIGPDAGVGVAAAFNGSVSRPGMRFR